MLTTGRNVYKGNQIKLNRSVSDLFHTVLMYSNNPQIKIYHIVNAQIVNDINTIKTFYKNQKK